jgi:hypothetical protein
MGILPPGLSATIRPPGSLYRDTIANFDGCVVNKL